MNVLRAEGRSSVGPVELFFDLVYVFAITQLSHFLLKDLDLSGALQFAVLFAAVWWGWNYSAWALNWLDPGNRTVRLFAAVWMFASLGMAIAIPDAYHERAGLFVASYLVLQLSRSAFMVWAFRGQRMSRNYAQLLAWSGIAGVVWVVGVFVPEEVRVWVWLAAVAVDYLAPVVGFRLPGVAATPISTWPVSEDHLAERNRLVFIVALGESIVILGATLTELEMTPAIVTAGVIGFASIVSLWWLYFDAGRGNDEHERIEVERAAHASRGGYAYAHALMVAGAVLSAVGVELVLAHPEETAHLDVTATVLGGPVVYLVGNLMYNRFVTGNMPVSRFVALGALVVIALISTFLPVLLLAGLVLAVLLVLAFAESGWFRLPRLSVQE
ncbi:low temperature requirement protein A [Glycomyces buryatensis]|uniref:Low temperature requirement protein A n=1 Tax=Glycomyces buryatensis TaxID=2570927 RepID=A0A4S8QHD1_9ACTN|nr:low temperature requirement protein A [Glycomyces buryatensis]THV40094.1 low temperature requirement protein A [Glycomyces buryatensis]